MGVMENIRKFRNLKGISTTDLGKLTGISQSTISKLENGKKKADIELLEKIAEALGVSVDRLTGEAASSIIESRLEELGITYAELAKKANISPYWLQNLDTFIPGEWGGNNDIAYKWITQVAEVLRLPSGTLRAALARQEAPVYDGPQESPEESFGIPYVDFETYPVGERIKVPIIGTVTAGPNGLACEDYQGEEWVDADRVNGGHYFYLRIKGDSMIGDGILPGDLALVRETPDVNSGTLAIVIVNGDEGTIKRVYKTEDSIILQASNPKIPPRFFKNEEMQSIRIVGEVKMTMRNY